MQSHPTKPNTDVIPVRRPAPSTPPHPDEKSEPMLDFPDVDSAIAHLQSDDDEPAAGKATPACPHCGAPMIDHGVDEGPKANAWHCNACGGCWVHRGNAWFSRDGHSPPVGWGVPTA